MDEFIQQNTKRYSIHDILFIMKDLTELIEFPSTVLIKKIEALICSIKPENPIKDEILSLCDLFKQLLLKLRERPFMEKKTNVVELIEVLFMNKFSFVEGNNFSFRDKEYTHIVLALQKVYSVGMQKECFENVTFHIMSSKKPKKAVLSISSEETPDIQSFAEIYTNFDTNLLLHSEEEIDKIQDQVVEEFEKEEVIDEEGGEDDEEEVKIMDDEEKEEEKEVEVEEEVKEDVVLSENTVINIALTKRFERLVFY
jgi:hypothetical protein